MRVACIGDIIGRPGRKMVQTHLHAIREAHDIDLVVANGENASHGFGLTPKNAQELFKAGVDVLTGGNHTWDKKELLPLLGVEPRILRPDNYPPGVPGCGVFRGEIGGERFAVLNLMGHYGMPMVENVLRWGERVVGALHEEGIATIIVDFHAEATSEKRAFFLHLKERISCMVGTHTHVGTDDLLLHSGAGYVSDIGLTGCRTNVIGMESKVPIERFLTGLPGRFEVPEKCPSILQVVVFEIREGRTVQGWKIKAYDDAEPFVCQKAWIEG